MKSIKKSTKKRADVNKRKRKATEGLSTKSRRIPSKEILPTTGTSEHGKNPERLVRNNLTTNHPLTEDKKTSHQR